MNYELLYFSFIHNPSKKIICSSHPATCSVVQQRFALLWGRGAYDVYNAKIQNADKIFGVCTSTWISPFSDTGAFGLKKKPIGI